MNNKIPDLETYERALADALDRLPASQDIVNVSRERVAQARSQLVEAGLHLAEDLGDLEGQQKTIAVLREAVASFDETP